jgi:hypothetical protein
VASKTKKGLLVLTAVLILLPVVGTGCSPRIVERVVYQRDTTVVHHRDTTYRRDSVWMKEYVKGDTVYVEKYKDRFVYRDRWRDSVRVVRDSVAVERVKEVKVEKPLSWSQKAKIGAFPWLVLALIGAALWIFRKYLF